MTDLAERYTREIRDQMDQLGTWRPNERLSLGSLGIMDGDRFVRQSDLKSEFGLTPGASRAIQEGNLSYHSEGGVNVDVGVGAHATNPGSTLIKAGTEIEVAFVKENAILLDLVNCTSRRIEDQLTLRRQILELWKERRWKPEMCAVVELVEATSMTALLSGGSKAGVSLKTTAEAAVTGTISLADAHLGLQVVSSKGIGLSLVAAPEATPLIRALRLKKHWWERDAKMAVEGLEAIEKEEPLAVKDHVSYFDLLGED
jgi:hypothetical protein